MAFLANVKTAKQATKMDKKQQLIRFKHGPSHKEPINKKLHLGPQ